MPFEKGHKHGKGRPKGTPNKDKKELIDMIQDKYPDWHPLIAMADMANNDAKITKDGIEVNEIDENLRFQACKEVCKYIVPQLKAIEVKGDAANPLALNVTVATQEQKDILDNL